MGIFSKLFGSYSTRELARIEPLKKKVLDLDEEYTALSDADLKEKTNEFRDRLEDGETLERDTGRKRKAHQRKENQERKALARDRSG